MSQLVNGGVLIWNEGVLIWRPQPVFFRVRCYTTTYAACMEHVNKQLVSKVRKEAVLLR